jgi:uncharacterized protein (DUF1501 family)
MNPLFDRRAFLSFAAAGAAGVILRPASAPSLFGRLPGAPEDDRILVVVQLSGGNDGLSTVGPFADDAYLRARRATRVDAAAAHKLSDAVRMHPSLKGLAALYDAGRLAVVQGVGYPQSNRSHFESFEIWHTADVRGRDLDTGWIGRYADLLPDGSCDANCVVHVGKTLPYSLTAKRRAPASFDTPDAYRWIGGETEAKALTEAAKADREAHPGREAALAKIRKTLLEAQESSASIRSAAAKYKAKAAYPRTGLGGALHTVAALVNGGVRTRVYSLDMGGYDTHVNQKTRHDALMTQLGDALKAFHDDLAAQGSAHRVVTLVFSEFGRRVAENGSAGTDHGSASTLFVLGAPVKGGLYGAYPSLVDLDRGDLKFTTDFRRVYATLLDRWMGSDADRVLAGPFERLGFL